ncbi:TIGR04141 family sporadically distributed protein [Sorangium sp. So ce1335]|uniref:TIGR04141 family sporadically distributed protein n=1 Tax=Sorangium sp. So ce1335 TaxID=3133335 RepID=UPI003F61CEEE
MKVKVRPLNIRLLKPSLVAARDAFRDPTALIQHSLKKNIGFKASLFLPAVPSRKPPAWVDLLNEGVRSTLSLVNATSSAVLLVETSQRFFAISFGYGSNLLRQELIERDFGLKVALNTVDPDALRSVDMHTMEDLTLHTRRQASMGSRLPTFGLDVTRDLMRSVTGRPRDPNIGRQVTGSDALVLNAEIAFTGIGVKCDRLLHEYGKKDYLKEFAFVDYVRKIRDTNLGGELDQLLIQELRAGTSTNAYLAAPKPIEWDRFAAFNYSTEGHADDHPDLDLAHYLGTIDTGALSISKIRRDRVGVKYADADVTREKWSIYDALVYEVTHKDTLYALSAGEWYVIEPSYARRIESDIKQIPTSGLKLPAANPDEVEKDYNERVSATMKDIALLDRGNRSVTGANTPIECCDLLTLGGQLVHVKRKTRSSTLSHLFSQGIASAEALFWDDGYRKKVVSLLKGHPAHARLLAAPTFNAASFEIVYAVITKRTPTWPASLPFLSQLNLANAARILRRMGYKVSLLRIDAP